MKHWPNQWAYGWFLKMFPYFKQDNFFDYSERLSVPSQSKQI